MPTLQQKTVGGGIVGEGVPKVDFDESQSYINMPMLKRFKS